MDQIISTKPHLKIPAHYLFFLYWLLFTFDMTSALQRNGGKGFSLTSSFCKINFCNRVSLRSFFSSNFQRHWMHSWPLASIILLGALMTPFKNPISQWRQNLKYKRDPINIQNVLWTIRLRSIQVVCPLSIRYNNTVTISIDVYLILPNKEALIRNWA